MNRWLALTMILCAFGGTVGCGSVKTRDVNEAEISRVRKVAVASFSYQQPFAASLLSPGGDTKAYNSEEVNGVLRDIFETFSKKHHWTMLSIEEMKANPAYRKVYDAKMNGWQTNKVPVSGKLFLVPGVMDAQSIRRLEPAERDQLMQALKVDAIVETDVNVTFAISGMAIMGIGPRHPQANINLKMYKRGVEAPVWFEGHMVGEPSTESVGSTGFFDEGVVTKLGRVSAKEAFAKAELKNQATN